MKSCIIKQIHCFYLVEISSRLSKGFEIFEKINGYQHNLQYDFSLKIILIILSTNSTYLLKTIL